MTTKIVRAGAVAALAIAVTATTFATEASAQRRAGRVAAGVAAGLIIGGIVAGAARANAGERVYVAPRASCGEYKRRAIWNEENGRPGRAQYWWDQYENCRG